MTVKEIYEADYRDYVEFGCNPQTKYSWAADIFGFVTYDSELDELFVKKIIEVCKAILDRETFEYIDGSRDNYIAYVLVCKLLDTYGWIDYWGSSIRGAWFHEGQMDRHYIAEPYRQKPVPFSIDNLRTLIEFVEEEKTNA